MSATTTPPATPDLSHDATLRELDTEHGALRYHEVFDGLRKVEIADHGFAYPSASELVQLAHAKALREEFVKPWEITPLYLRKPDVDINWSTRESA